MLNAIMEHSGCQPASRSEAPVKMLPNVTLHWSRCCRRLATLAGLLLFGPNDQAWASRLARRP